MKKLKTYLTAFLLILCFGSFTVYAAEAFIENETPFLPAFSDNKKDENTDNTPSDTATSRPANPGISNQDTYIPSINPSVKPEAGQTPTQTETNVKTFVDVNKDDWYYSDVQFVFNNKIMTGTSETEFSPNTTVNRAMMVTILHRMDKDASVYEKNIFHDVEKNSWYENAVAWGYENKIITGTSKITFAPMDTLTREQLCVMLYKYTKYIGKNTAFADISCFSDTKTVSDWAKDAVSWAVQEKIITGKGNNLLAPKDGATRAETAAVIRRYTKNLQK